MTDMNPAGAARSAAPHLSKPSVERADDAIDRLAQWRRIAARRQAAKVDAILRTPDKRLTLLRIFSTSPYLADIAMSQSEIVVDVFMNGPSETLAQTARDLSTFDRGVGGPDELNSALSPLKERIDLAIALAEISGTWNSTTAAAVRTDFAERLIETSLQWLIRNAFRMGDAQNKSTETDVVTNGVFILAGEDFAHEELSYFGPISLLIAYDREKFNSHGVQIAENALQRLGVDLRRALESAPGGRSLYAPKPPDLSGTAACPLICGIPEIRTSLERADSAQRVSWFQTARVVAGDRILGGEFMEELASKYWEGHTDASEILALIGDAPDKPEDPNPVIDKLAQICRLTLGRNRPAFRNASARHVFETAAQVEALPHITAERLSVICDFARDLRNYRQLAIGGPGRNAPQSANMTGDGLSTATLCGFPDVESMKAAASGYAIHAAAVLRHILSNDVEEITSFGADLKAHEGDEGKLEELGFQDGHIVSGMVTRWLEHSGEVGGRLAELAPGFLTMLAETQNPEMAADLFDRYISSAPDDFDIFGLFRKRPTVMTRLADQFGCYSHFAQASVAYEDMTKEVLDELDEETPIASGEWLSRFTPPWRGADEPPSFEAVAEWFDVNRSRLGMYAADRGIDFDVISNAATDITETVLEALTARAIADASDKEKDAAKHICVLTSGHFVAGRALFAHPLPLSFVYDKADAEIAEKFAKRLIEIFECPVKAIKGFTVDVRARSGGVSGSLVSSIKEFRDHNHMQAAAIDQIHLACYRTVAGHAKAQEAVRKVIMDAAVSARRTDYLMRDADRTRVQRLRRDSARSIWDVERLEGGLSDIDLLTGGLKIKYASTRPYVFTETADETLAALVRAGALDQEFADELCSARRLWRRLLMVQDLSGWRGSASEQLSPRLARQIAKAAGVSEFADVEALIRGRAERVNVIYNHLMLGRERPQSMGKAPRVAAIGR